MASEPQVMQFKVSQLLKEPVGAVRDYSIDDNLDIFEGVSAHVTGSVHIIRTNRGILVKARISTAVILACSRCLAPYSCPLSFEFEEEYFPLLDIVRDAHLPEPEEEESFTIDEHHVLDLSEAVRQYALLTVPMKPLCRAQCPGVDNIRSE